MDNLSAVLELPTAGHDYSPDEVAFMQDGLCRNFDPLYWDTNTRNGHTGVRGKYVRIRGEDIRVADQIEFARNICFMCPVRDACKDFIRKYPEEEGIWAGLLPEERRG
jgi:hypothetical protein